MAPWIEDRRKYIESDFRIAEIAPQRLVIEDLYRLLGKQEVYSLDQAQRLHKKQLSAKEYRKFQDSETGISEKMMLNLLRMRCEYVIRRGSTLNNPHIPKAVLDKFPMITSDHAVELRRLVNQALKS